MKKLFTLLLIVFFTAYAGNLFATPVKVFRSNFSIDGYIDASSGGHLGEAHYYQDGYSGSDTAPLSDYTESPAGLGIAYASSRAGFFYVESMAFADGESFAGAYAYGEWIFQPLSPMDHLTIYTDMFMGGPWATCSAELIDLTDTTKIWSKYDGMGGIGPDWGWPDLIAHSFQTNHAYRLYFQVAANANADSWNPYFYTNDMTAVIPEPTALILLSLGLMGLAGTGRKLQK